LPISTVWTPEPPETITPTEPDNPDTPEKPKVLTYTQLEYIKTTPTQYINTGIGPALDLSIEYTVQGNNTEAQTTDIYLFGRKNANTNNSGNTDVRSSIRIVKKTLNKLDVYWNKKRMNGTNTNTSSIIIDKFSYLTKHTYKLEPSQWSIDGTIYVTTANSNSTNKYFNDYPIYLNGLNNGTKGHEFGSNFNIYDCKFYKGTTLFLDMVPAINNLTNETGLYDKINSKFYTNAETNGSSFEAGPKTDIILTPSTSSGDYSGMEDDNDGTFTGGTGGSN